MMISKTKLSLALTGALVMAACTDTQTDSAPATASTQSDMSAADTTAQAGASTELTPAPTSSAGGNPTVGGAAMDSTKSIAVNASAAPNLSTLVAAAKAAGLVETLAGPGPFTVFAPTNEAFNRLAPGTVDTLLKPENKASLTKVLTYHVVPGTLSSAQLTQQITAGGGKAMLTTVAGETLTATVEGGVVLLTDVNGNKSYIETPDVRQSNGVVHVVNGVLIPKMG